MQNDVRLIDANALIKDLHLMAKFQDPYKCSTILGVCSTIEARKTVDAVPVVHANNVTPTHLTDMFVCGSCGFTCEITKLIYEDEDYPEVGIPIAFEYDCKYCPDCGAKMDGGAKGV